MGFYGNITNTAKTQFQFDRIYPNRYELELNKAQDGIYQGRYVLIEYDSDLNLDDFDRVWIDSNGYGYTSPNMELTSRIDGGSIEKDTIVRTQTVDLTPENGLQAKDCIFYKCTVANTGSPAIFEYAVDSDSNYVLNFNIDTSRYGASRGYDSTVWQKVFDNGQDKYVMIAELNTVVPTFDVVADAPTVEPITPHFDIDSTDVYYKLHVQPQWGLKIKAQEDETKSDETVDYNWVEYNPATNENENKSLSYNGDIYYNKKGFEEFTPRTQDDATVNEIFILPTGKSGKEYSTHIGAGTSQQIDTQEVTIHLPAVGNVVADAWDIIHGPERDDNTADSLQGRLNFFKSLDENEIPVQSDKYLVGSKINGNTNRIVEDQNILNEELSESFESDDAWIKTVIQTAKITEGQENNPEDPSYHQQAISIHHTFHSVEDTTSTSDVNGNGDTINLYTPYVDAAGHVVGNNIETVTLPYGFKFIQTNGRVEADNYNTSIPSTSEIEADNTQDTLTINGGNKWVKIDTDADNDIVTISHDILKTSSSTSTQDLTSETAATTFEVPTYEFDEAGHYSSHDTKTITVPFGYGKVIGDSGNTAATATFDTLAFGSDDWLTATISKDTVIYSHDYPKKLDNTISTSDINGNGNTIVLETISLDEKGHVRNTNQNTVTLPFGYKVFEDSNSEKGSSTAQSTQDTFTFKGDNWIKPTIEQGIATFTHIGPVSENATSTTVNNQTPAFGAIFNVPYITYDNKGHIVSNGTTTVKVPQGSLTLPTLTNSSVITNAAFTANTGKLELMATNVGDLILTGYSAATGDTIKATDSINNAFNKVSTRIKNHEDKLDALIGGDLTEAFDTLSEMSKWLNDNDIELEASLIEKDNQLQQAIETEIYNRTTAITNLSKTVTDNHTSVTGSINTLSGTVSDNYTTLDNKINTEISDRTTAIDNLTSTVNDNNTALTTRVKALEDENTALKSRVAALENAVAAIQATIEQYHPAEEENPEEPTT